MYVLALVSQLMTADGEAVEAYTTLLGDLSYSGCATMIESRTAIDAGAGTVGVLLCKPQATE